MLNASSNSVSVISFDLQAVQRALEQHVAALSPRPEVVRVVLFGSMATGRYAPGSDVDLLIVLSHSARPFRDRIPDYLPNRFPVDMDVFPYTKEEASRLDLPRTALREGRVLWERKPAGS